MTAPLTLEQLAERVSHLEGWKESQERFSQELLAHLGQVDERLSRLEEQLRFLDQKWEARLSSLEERWEARFGTLEERWEKRFGELRADLKHLDERWEARFNQQQAFWEQRFNQQQAFWEQRFKEMGTRFWWLVGLQFTILLAILALWIK